MKIDVGDYVRTRWGCIAKFEGIHEGFYEFDNIIMDESSAVREKLFVDIVEKSSTNIIELFEEHDLVVIEYYSLRYNERVTRLFEVTFKDGEYINLSNAKCEFMLVNGEFNKGDKELEPIIKSIVTKECFESMEYKIER